MTTRRTKKSIARANRFAVILAGGVGSRFWPWSRRDLPKQLLALAGNESMLADTAARVRAIVPRENILVVTGANLRRGVRRALPWLPASGILCEPSGRNTAPCVGWAAVEILARNPAGAMLVLPADHVVSPLAKFQRSALEALTLAGVEQRLVTFGIEPTSAATGYGYIRAGAKPIPGTQALPVEAFHEKPSPARAKRFLAGGRYYWNSGMFAWRADTVLEEIDRHLPSLRRGLRRLDAIRRGGRIPKAAIERIYPRLPSISIDHGVMEKSDRAAMLPARFAWSDMGDWDAVSELWPADSSGNHSRDPIIAVDSRENVVATKGKPVALIGVSGLAIVDAGDALLVCPRDRAQDVRSAVAALGSAGLSKLS